MALSTGTNLSLPFNFAFRGQ